MPIISETQTSREFEKYWLGNKNSSIYIRSTGEFILVSPDREKKEIKKGFGEIFWPISGEAVFYLDEKKYLLSPGHVWYYPPDSLHDFYPVEKFHYCWLAVAGRDAEKLFSLMQLTPGLNKAMTCPVYLFRSIQDDLDSVSVSNKLNALTTTTKILAMIHVIPHDPGVKKNKIIYQVKEQIDNNLDDTALSVERLAYENSIHRGSLSRAFKKCFGITISDYIISRRLQKATDLLLSTDSSITEIATSCGMNSAHYFSKVFTEKTGTTPSDFRRRK